MWKLPALRWRTKLSKHAVVIASVCIALAAMSGCEQDVIVDAEFSVNLLRPGPKYPNMKKLSPRQKEVFQKRGRPDFLRIFWTPDGRVKQHSELQRELDPKKIKDLPPHSWVYVRDNIEISFPDSGETRETALTDQVRLLTQYGDPEDVKDIGGYTQWTYYGVGKLFKFDRGTLVQEQDLPPMGKFRKS